MLTEPFISVLREHRAAQNLLRASPQWQPKPEFADLIFLNDDGSLITLNRDNDDWARLLKRFGLPHWRAHLNRHITATWLAEQDPPVSIGTVQSILGHDTEAMTTYYSKTTNRQQSGPMQRYGSTIARIIETGRR